MSNIGHSIVLSVVGGGDAALGEARLRADNKRVADRMVVLFGAKAAGVTSAAVKSKDIKSAGRGLLFDMIYREPEAEVKEKVLPGVAWSPVDVAKSSALSGGAFNVYLQRANERMEALRRGQKSLARLNKSLGRAA